MICYYDLLCNLYGMVMINMINMINLGVGLKIFHHFINRCASETKLFEAGEDLSNGPDERFLGSWAIDMFQASKTMWTQWRFAYTSFGHLPQCPWIIYDNIWIAYLDIGVISCVCLKNVSLERLVPHWSHVMLGSADRSHPSSQVMRPLSMPKRPKPRWDPLHPPINHQFF